MNVESAYSFPESNETEIAVQDLSLPPNLPLKTQSSAAKINGPIIGMVLMAAISLPLVCMAALSARTPQTAVASAAPVAAAAPAPLYVYWNYNFDAAQQIAATSNKSMMIDFYTDWCPACKSLDANVYSRPEIAAEAQSIVPLKINAEGQPDLARRYNVTKYPTIIWTDSAGNEKARQVGGSSAYDFFYTMQQNR
jgi:thiol:disulfide interchange protein